MNLKEGAKYLRHSKTGVVYPHSAELEDHPDCKVFVHQAKPAPKRAPARAPAAPATQTNTAPDVIDSTTDDGLPETDPGLLDELANLTDLDDPEGDPQ